MFNNVIIVLLPHFVYVQRSYDSNFILSVSSKNVYDKPWLTKAEGVEGEGSNKSEEGLL